MVAPGAKSDVATSARFPITMVIAYPPGAITDTVRKGAEKVHLISESAREQLEGSKEMVKAIEEISLVARNNSASTEAIQSVIQEQTSAVARMASLANVGGLGLCTLPPALCVSV